jgi:signal transduction histidine kinase
MLAHKPMPHAHQRHQALLDYVPAILFETRHPPDQDGLRLDFVTEHAQRLSGYPVERWLSDPTLWRRVVPPGEFDRTIRALHRLWDEGGETELEHQWRAADGRLLWVRTHVIRLEDPDGGFVLRGVITDTTRLKRAHATLRKRAAALIRVARALKKSNDELDQFAYVTSHDLRAPLRGIANLSQWIEEDLDQQMTPKARGQMELLRGRVRRMDNLINGILRYSRVGRTRIGPEQVDVAKLIADVVDLVAPPAGFAIHTDSMPVLVATKVPLQQVFMNLITNAFKHHHNPSHGNVWLKCREEQDLYEFIVADDGPGIAPSYHKRIFVIFQTLLPRDRLEGTGVGLSLVKKIVEYEGGSIKLDSARGKGATFRFTWPKNPGKPAAHGRPPNQHSAG